MNLLKENAVQFKYIWRWFASYEPMSNIRLVLIFRAVIYSGICAGRWLYIVFDSSSSLMKCSALVVGDT